MSTLETNHPPASVKAAWYASLTLAVSNPLSDILHCFVDRVLHGSGYVEIARCWSLTPGLDDQGQLAFLRGASGKGIIKRSLEDGLAAMCARLQSHHQSTKLQVATQVMSVFSSLRSPSEGNQLDVEHGVLALKRLASGTRED